MEKSKRLPTSLIVFFVISFVCLILAFLFANHPEKELTLAESSWYTCRQFISEQLVAPSTADFQLIDRSKIRQTSDNYFDMTMYVDAENSFGAKLRTKFYCELIYRNDTWYLLELRKLQ